MNFNVLNKINETENIIKEIRDNLNKTKTSEKDKFSINTERRRGK
jgi:hypothetical protein